MLFSYLLLSDEGTRHEDMVSSTTPGRISFHTSEGDQGIHLTAGVQTLASASETSEMLKDTVVIQNNPSADVILGTDPLLTLGAVPLVL